MIRCYVISFTHAVSDAGGVASGQRGRAVPLARRRRGPGLGATSISRRSRRPSTTCGGAPPVARRPFANPAYRHQLDARPLSGSDARLSTAIRTAAICRPGSCTGAGHDRPTCRNHSVAWRFFHGRGAHRAVAVAAPVRRFWRSRTGAWPGASASPSREVTRSATRSAPAHRHVEQILHAVLLTNALKREGWHRPVRRDGSRRWKRWLRFRPASRAARRPGVLSLRAGDAGRYISRLPLRPVLRIVRDSSISRTCAQSRGSSADPDAHDATHLVRRRAPP